MYGRSASLLGYGVAADQGGVPPRPSTAVGIYLVNLCPYLLPGTGKPGWAASPEVTSLETVNSH